jgi:Flp pilus assembly protein TadD
MRMAIANYNLGKAITMIEEVNQLAPDQAPFIDTKGVVLFMSGDYSGAKKCFEKANELQPNEKNYVEHLGDVYFKLGDATKALELWKKAQQLGSKNKSLDKKIQTKTYVAPVY